MKCLIIYLAVLILISCSEEKKTSLKPLLVDYVDDIPYLIHQKQIDSVFEIITFGEISRSTKNDTINLHVLDTDNRVRQKLKSFMCCSYVFEFDSLGLLKQKELFSDYTEYFSYDRLRKGDTIFENQNSNMGNEIKYIYQLQNEKIVSRVGKIQELSKFKDSTIYEYNKNNKLKTKIRIRIHDPSGDYDDDTKSVTSYTWNQNVLERVEVKDFSIKHDSELSLSSFISFDSTGFPVRKVVLIDRDTVAITSLVKNRNHSCVQ